MAESSEETKPLASQKYLENYIDYKFFNSLAIEVISSHNTTAPARLYHYTNGDGLLGIIKTNSLRFSDTRFLNDGSEIRFGVQVAMQSIEAMVRDHADITEELGKKLVQEVAETAERHQPIVFCMCEENNLLNQWRDYGRDIVPYSIEFDPIQLQQPVDFVFPAYLGQVIYDDSLQISLMRQLLERLYIEFRRLKDSGQVHDADSPRLLKDAAMQIALLAFRFKNSAFDSEKEWRLICHSPDIDEDLKIKHYRPSSLGVVPYYDWKRLDEGLLPITSVTVGPSPYSEISDLALKNFLHDHQYDVPTYYSTIPIRR